MSSNSRQVTVVHSLDKSSRKPSADQILKKKLAKAKLDFKRAQHKLELYKNCAVLHNQRRYELLTPQIDVLNQMLKQWVKALIHAHQKFKWNPSEYDAIEDEIMDAIEALAAELPGDAEVMELLKQYNYEDDHGEDENGEEQDPEDGDGDGDGDEWDDLFNDGVEGTPSGAGHKRKRSLDVEFLIDQVHLEFGLDREIFSDCQTVEQVAYILRSKIGPQGTRDASPKADPRQKKPITVRELYRKLASILHPDKETDADLRAEKTELMKKLNNAYRDNDIETMMNMQVELTQSDIGDLVNDREVLNLTIEHLNRQIAKLKREADDFVGQLSHIRGIKKIKKMEDVEATIDDMIHDQLSSLQVHQMALENEIKFCFISKKAMKSKVRLWVEESTAFGGFGGRGPFF